MTKKTEIETAYLLVSKSGNKIFFYVNKEEKLVEAVIFNKDGKATKFPYTLEAGREAYLDALKNGFRKV